MADDQKPIDSVDDKSIINGGECSTSIGPPTPEPEKADDEDYKEIIILNEDTEIVDLNHGRIGKIENLDRLPKLERVVTRVRVSRINLAEKKISDLNTKRLIQTVQGFPELYTGKHHDSKNNIEKKELAWRKVAEKTKLDVDNLKKKWKNIKDAYNKYKKSKKATCGKSAKRYANWLWADQLAFLDSAKVFRIKKEPIDEEESLLVKRKLKRTKNGRKKDCKKRKTVPASADKIKDSQTPQKTTIQDNPPKNMSTIDYDMLDLEFLGYAENVRKLSLRKQIVVKLNIAKIIAEAQLNELDEAAASSRRGT